MCILGSQIMKNIPEGDIKHKLEYLNEYFKHYPDDASAL